MPSVDIDVTNEVGRVAAALRTAIRLSGVSHRQIERKLNMSTGYLTRILAGKVELRVNHVLKVCHTIGLPPGGFFAALFPARKGAAPTTADRLSRGLAQLHPVPMRSLDLETWFKEFGECVDQLRFLLSEEQEGFP